MSYLKRAPLLLAFVIVSAGCVSINVNHDLKKDGSSDIAMEVQSDSQLLRNSLKESLRETLYTENAVLSEGEDSFKYSFEDVYVNGTVLENVGQESGESPDVNTERESGLIYTTYRVEIDSEGMKPSDLNMDSGLGTSGLGPSPDTDSLTSGVELNYNVDPFGQVMETNGQRLEDGRVRFDLTEDKDYYIEFRAFSADLFLTRKLGSSPEKPEFQIGEWSECSREGIQTRKVEIEQGEESLMVAPPEQRECEYQARQR